MTRRVFLMLLAACLLLLAGAAALRPRGPAPVPLKLTLAMPAQMTAGAVHVGLAHGLFERHGLALATQSYRTGKQALDAVLAGQADLALVGDTPFVLAALRGEEIGIVSTVFSSRKTMALVGRRERGIGPGASLAGRTVGTVRGTNAQYFLEALLLAQGLDRGQVNVVELPADGLAEALRAGRIDAATLWQPELARLQAELGLGGATIYGDDLFVFRFVLVGRRAYLSSQNEVVTRALSALADATDLVHDQPDAAAAVIGRALALEHKAFAAAFDASDYRLTLDQSLLLSLSAQTRWARRLGLERGGGAPPDYLGLLYQRPLRAVRPDAVRVIQ
jgi:NitT/TauT family transport system substrate-binding protein